MSWVTSLHALSTPDADDQRSISRLQAGGGRRREPWSMQHHAPCVRDGTPVWEPHGSQRRTLERPYMARGCGVVDSRRGGAPLGTYPQ